MTQPTQQEETPDIISVVHSDFQLHDGFIEPVNRITNVPDGYIGISNASDFARIGLNPDANYILMADIDMTGTEFDPISGFSGILEGNGHTVSNCEATIFSTVDGGTVRNVGVYADWKLEGADDMLENLHHQAGIIGWAGVTEPYVTLTVEKCVNGFKTQFEGYYDEVAGILNVMEIEEGCIIVTNCCNRGVWCDFGLVGGDALQTRWDKISDDLMNVVIEYSYNWSNSFYGISKVCKNLNYCYNRDTCDYSTTVDGALFATVSAISQDDMKLESSYPGFDFETVWQMGEDWPEYRQTDY